MRSTSPVEEGIGPCNTKLPVSEVTEQPSIRLKPLQHALHGRACLSFLSDRGSILSPSTAKSAVRDFSLTVSEPPLPQGFGNLLRSTGLPVLAPRGIADLRFAILNLPFGIPKGLPVTDATGAAVPERRIGSEALEASAKLRISSIDCLSAASFEAARSEQLTPIRNSFDRKA